MKTQTIFRRLLVGVLLLFTGSTALAQPLGPGDEIPLDVVLVFDRVPGISYISQAGIDYYKLNVDEGSGDINMVTDPISEYTKLHIEVRGRVGETPGPGPKPRLIQALVYSADSEEVYELVSGQSGSPYLNGKVYIFKFVYNPDEEELKSAQPVHRIAVLGLTANDQFGFFRVIDTFGESYPTVANTADDFQIWSSPASVEHMGSPYYKELVVEAGSPAVLGGKR